MTEKCKGKTEVYSRVVGYFRPTSAWNKGKQSEYKDRKEFNIGKDPVKGDGKCSPNSSQ